MIIKGGSRSNGGFFAGHVVKGQEDENGNDRVELKEMRGVTANTVDGFFREIAAVASGTRCKNYFYHASLSPEPTDQLTPAQRIEAVDRLEKNLGLTGQPRFVIEHEKDGRTHQHVIWSRIDIDTMTARSDKLTYPIHERTSREIEEAFDLVRGRSVLVVDRDGPRPERRPSDWEGFQASQKAVIDKSEIKAELTGLWCTADSGTAFAAALDERGYALARGDQRGYVVVDHAGDVHSLARCIDGVKTAGVRERMADIDLAGLPSVAEAREAQRAPFTQDGSFDRQAAVQAWQDRGYELLAQEPGRAAAEIDARGPPSEVAALEATLDRPVSQDVRGEDAAPTRDPGDTGPTPGDDSAPPAGAIRVSDKFGNIIGGIGDILGNLMTLGDSGSKPASQNPYLEQMEERDRAREALEHIRADMARGEAVRLQDLQNLTPEHRRGLVARGDEALRDLVRRDDDERDRRLGGGRER